MGKVYSSATCPLCLKEARVSHHRKGNPKANLRRALWNHLMYHCTKWGPGMTSYDTSELIDDILETHFR